MLRNSPQHHIVSTSQVPAREPPHVPATDLAPSGHWTEEIGRSSECATCGRPRSGTYCSQCGQKHLETRLKFRGLVKNLFSELTNLERGVLHTFVGLLKRPGIVARDYISGKQRPYVNPLTYFLLGAAIQLLSLHFTKPVLHPQLRNNVQQGLPLNNPEALSQLQKVYGDDPATTIADIYFGTMQQAYTYAALLFFCLPFAIMLAWLHRFAGERFRLGETMVFALFTFAQMLTLTAFMSPVLLRIGTGWQAAGGFGTYLLFPLYAHSGFFQATWSSRVMTLISTVIATGIFVLSIVGIFLASIVLTALMNAGG